eukprot:GHRQ01010683.1.p1 GENE.GHRQ01010683.1~~GHRQ01010683.1.p1  ORF type:complete len:145 (-),score=30.47 GHRQ01010683.1:144-578(-)
MAGATSRRPVKLLSPPPHSKCPAACCYRTPDTPKATLARLPHMVCTPRHATKPSVAGTSPSACGMNPKSSISSADTVLPAATTPSARGSSSNAFADRADSSLLLIWLPVEQAYQPSCPAAAPQELGILRSGQRQGIGTQGADHT